jgi:3-hydroxyisobutyrate dehydrogenase
MRVGFVGIGNMGTPMVRCLIAAGHTVRVYDVNSARAAAVARDTNGVTVAIALSDLADSDAVITMLPDSAVVRSVLIGSPDQPGLVAALPQGALVVDMSSSYAPETIALGDALTARGVHLVDAPVSGGVGKAVSGNLAIMAGGSHEAVERAAPLLSAMGQVHRTGKLGSGHALKALNNYVSAAGLIATCEALLAGKAFGLDPVVMTRVINASTGRNNTTENKAERYLIPETFDSGFALALMSKDVGMAHALTRDLGLPAEELAFVDAYLKRAAKVLGPSADHTAVMAFARKPGSA